MPPTASQHLLCLKLATEPHIWECGSTPYAEHFLNLNVILIILTKNGTVVNSKGGFTLQIIVIFIWDPNVD